MWCNFAGAKAFVRYCGCHCALLQDSPTIVNWETLLGFVVRLLSPLYRDQPGPADLYRSRYSPFACHDADTLPIDTPKFRGFGSRGHVHYITSWVKNKGRVNAPMVVRPGGRFGLCFYFFMCPVFDESIPCHIRVGVDSVWLIILFAKSNCSDILI